MWKRVQRTSKILHELVSGQGRGEEAQERRGGILVYSWVPLRPHGDATNHPEPKVPSHLRYIGDVCRAVHFQLIANGYQYAHLVGPGHVMVQANFPHRILNVLFKILRYKNGYRQLVIRDFGKFRRVCHAAHLAG